MPALKPNNLGIIYDTYAPNAVLANGATVFVELPVRPGTLGLFVGWADATSNVAITLWSTCDPNVSKDSTAADKWHEETGVVITGPTAAAIDCSVKHIGNQGASRLRLRLVAAADSRLRIAANYNEA